MSELEQLLDALRALPKEERKAAALLADPRFARSVELLAAADDEALLAAAGGKDGLYASVALEALRRRPADPDTIGATLFELLERMRGQRAVFLLRALDAHAGDAFLTLVFARAGEPWRGAALETLREIAERRRDEPIAVAGIADEHVDAALMLAESLRAAIADGVLESLRGLAAQRRIAGSLRSIARVRRTAEVLETGERLLRDDGFDRDVVALAEAVRSGKPLLVVGERGSGRLSRLRGAAALLADDGWMTFEAGAAEINAGMTYVGELEGRISHLVRTLDGERVLWIAPSFEALLYAGVTRQNPQGGVLDLLLAGHGRREDPRRRHPRARPVRAADPRSARAARRVRRRAGGADGRAAHAGARRAGRARHGPGGAARGARARPPLPRRCRAAGRAALPDRGDAPPPAGRGPADDERRALDDHRALRASGLAAGRA